MKKIKLFDWGVFQEGFRHLKIPGIIFLFFNIVPLIINFIWYLSTRYEVHDIISYSDSSLMSAASYSIFSLFLLLIYLLIAPVLTISAFRFLSKRNASDIYHSLPFKRETLFISLFSAITAWLAIIVIAKAVLSLVFGLIIDIAALSLSTIVSTALTSFLVMLFISACFAVAATITGTLESNFVVGLLIAYLPRILIYSITNAIISTLPILAGDKLGFLLDNRSNLATSYYSILAIFDSSLYKSRANVSAYIYTFVVSLLYIALACILFRRRKSEIAGQSAPNRTLQAVYRISLCMFVCVFVLTSLFSSYTSNSSKSFYSTFAWYILAVVVYFAYELITTRQFKNLVKALPGLAIVVGLNFLLFGIMAGVRSYELNFTPEKEEISSVSVALDNASYNSNYSMRYNNYIYKQTINIDIYDDQAISIVADSLKKNVDALKVSRQEYFNRFMPQYDTHYISATVKINTSYGSKYRKIYILESDIIKIEDIYHNTNEFKELYKNLPKKSGATVSISAGSITLDNKRLSDEKLNEIYDKVREDVAKGDFDLLYDKINNANSASIVLNYSFYIDSQLNYIKVPLRPDITPGALEMFMQEYYAVSSDTREEVIESLNNTSNKNIQLTIFDTKNDTYESITNASINWQVFAYVRNRGVESAPKIGDTVAVIKIYEHNSSTGIEKQLDAIINLGEVSLEEIYKTKSY